MNRLSSSPMADLFWASVEARPVFGKLFLPSSSVSVPWGLLKFCCRPRNRVAISGNRKPVGCLISRTKSPPTTDAASSLPSTPEPSSPPPAPPTGVSDFDIISTSEHSDGSIVFRFGDATEMEQISVQLDGAEVSSVSDSEVASESLPSEDGETVSVLGVLREDQQEPERSDDSSSEVASESLSTEDGRTVALSGVIQEDQQEPELSGESVSEVALESLSKDTKRVVVLEEAESNAVQLEEKPQSRSVVELPVAQLEVERVDDDSIPRGPSDHHALSESHELPESSEQTQLGLETLDSFDREMSLDILGEDVTSPVAEPPVDDSGNVEDSGAVGTEFYTSSTPVQTASAASLVEKASDIEESPQAKSPEEDESPAPTDPDDKAIRLEEGSTEETTDGDSEAVDFIESPQGNTIIDDDAKAVKEEEEEPPIKTEEEDTTTAFSGTVTGSSEEQTEENIEVELPDLPTISAADEPEVDTSAADITSEDTEEAASLPASTIGEAVSSDDENLDNDGESSTPEEAVDGDEKLDITEMLDINTDESESDKSNSRREEIVLSEFYLSSGAASLPHPSKALAGGEDAYFVGDKNWFGVADGAGHWSMEGTNTGLYAKELMEKCKVIASSPVNHPRDVLVRSTAETEAIGSSTALVAHFEDKVLLVASIGDSGFIVIRNGIVIERSRPTVHEFNFPVQIESGDDPSEHTECYRIELDEEDVIVAATDGLFDNLYEQEIATIVFRSLQAGLSPQAVAEVLAARAREVGSCTSARSPFSDAAQAAGYAGFTGGKLDDVTVIVSLVQRRSSSSQQVVK